MIIFKIMNIIKKIRNIIIGLYKYLFKPTSKLAKNRLKICKRCSHRTKFLGKDTCGLCGCFIHLKAEVKEEHCDDDRW